MKGTVRLFYVRRIPNPKVKIIHLYNFPFIFTSLLRSFISFFSKLFLHYKENNIFSLVFQYFSLFLSASVWLGIGLPVMLTRFVQFEQSFAQVIHSINIIIFRISRVFISIFKCRDKVKVFCAACSSGSGTDEFSAIRMRQNSCFQVFAEVQQE